MQTLSIICALTDDGAIGRGGQLLFHLREDLRRFKRLTLGRTVVMGRRTFESLPHGPLPGRRNLVLTHGGQLAAYPEVETFASLEAALEACRDDAEVFVIGGASVYAAALPLATRLYLTHIHATAPDADTFFPEWHAADWEEFLLPEDAEAGGASSAAVPAYTFRNYRRRGLSPEL